MGFEIEIIKTLQKNTSEIFDIFLKLVSHLANYIGFILVFLILFIFLNKKYSIYFALTYGFSILFNFILKIVINRPRPYIVDNSIINILPGSGNAMPSGHTLSATILICFILYIIWDKKYKNYIKILATFISLIFLILTIISRMYLGQHYLTDTIVGFLEGLIFSITSLNFYKIIKEKENNNANKNQK